jgi:hypothetical protein
LQDCPRNAGGVRRTIRESSDFNPAGTRAERVQIVNEYVKWVCGARFCSLRHVFDNDAGKGCRDAALGFDQRQTLLTRSEPNSGG